MLTKRTDQPEQLALAANIKSSNALCLCNERPADATRKDKEAFSNYWLSNYEVQNRHDNFLSEYFANDFQELFEDDFTAFSFNICQILGNLLQILNVYTSKEQIIVIAQTFLEILQNDLPWPEEDSKKRKS